MGKEPKGRIFDLLDETTDLLGDALRAVTLPITAQTDAEIEERYVRGAVTLLSFACYSAAETMRVLVRSTVTLQLPALVRQQFEAAISATYIVVINKAKARDFILLDDFERFDLSREKAASDNVSSQTDFSVALLV